LVCLSAIANAQKADTVIDRITQFPNHFLAKIQHKTDHLDEQLTKQTERYLARLSKREDKLRKKLYKIDSNAAKSLFNGSKEKYFQLQNQLQSAGSDISQPLHGEYLPNIDSLKGSLSFLSKNQDLLKLSPQVQQQLSGSLTSFNQLQSNLQSVDQIKEFIRQRKQQMKDVVSNYSNSLGLKKYLDDYNKQVYYYSQQVKEYKEMLNDPNKMEQKALALLNQLPAFKEFMKNNSQLAGMFSIPGDYGTAAGLEGMQTRDQVQALIQSQIGGGNSSTAMASLQSSLQSAHQQMDQFKDKLNALGGGSGDIDMPDFRPKSQKTKSFLKRLELGTNLQTTRSNYFYPTTTDIGLSLGFKIGNTNVVGIGGSYKIGWGTDIQHIHYSSEGASIRSFVDIQMKKNFYISGGLEYNYQQPFTSFQQISAISHWQQSGLIGISKMVSLRSKLVKKTKIQLLWDFLSYYQMPRAQPFKFRVGYNF
jgi:hypothetical protein